MALYITESEVAAALDMPATIDCMEQVMAAHGRGEVIDYPRQRVRLPHSMTHLLQGGLTSQNISGFKAYTSSKGVNRFWVHLFDAACGAALAVIEADLLGMMRTGATCAVAARALASANPQSIAVLGAGWQARGQIAALAAIYPNLPEIRVFARNQERLSAFCDQMQQDLNTNTQLRATTSAEQAVREADIVVTITTSPKPLIEMQWLKKGVHINAAGSNSLVRRELPEDLLRQAALICVDSRESAMREAGDLLPLTEKGRSTPEQWVTLGEVLNQSRRGRQQEDELTIFESQGMAIQDLALAALAFERVQQSGGGTPLPY